MYGGESASGREDDGTSYFNRSTVSVSDEFKDQ